MAEHATIVSIMKQSSRKENQVVPLPEVQDDYESNEYHQMGLDQQTKLYHLLISGQRFTVSQDLINKYPDGKLANLEKHDTHYIPSLKAYYFDRDPTIFAVLLNIYRYEHFRKPAHIDNVMLLEELRFWELPSHLADGDELLDECSAKLNAEFDALVNRIPLPKDVTGWEKAKYIAWYFMTDPIGPHTMYKKAAIAYAFFMVTVVTLFMIFCGMGTSMHYRTVKSIEQLNDIEYLSEQMETVESKGKTNGTDITKDSLMTTCQSKLHCYIATEPLPWLFYAIVSILLLFLIETLIKIAVCPIKKVYFTSLLNWLDIIACLFTFVAIPLSLMTGMTTSHLGARMEIACQSIQVLRVFRIFQYASLFDGLAVMVLTVKASLQEILVLIVYLLIGMFIFSNLISFAELHTEMSGGIPDSLIGYWWAIITMTTVGYGDYYPSTALGYGVGTCCAITGLMLTALPVAVIGSNFNVYWEHNKKRRLEARKQILADKHNSMMRVTQLNS